MVLLIQVSIKGLLTSGTHVSFIFLFFFQGSGKHHLLCWEFILPRCLPCLGNPHHTHQVDRSAGGDKEEAEGWNMLLIIFVFSFSFVHLFLCSFDQEAPKVETCCSICSPYNGLTILHHLEQRCAILSVIFSHTGVAWPPTSSPCFSAFQLRLRRQSSTQFLRNSGSASHSSSSAWSRPS